MKIIFTLLLLLYVLPFLAQWELQNSGVSVGLNDVFCITEDIVVVVGNEGTILKTSNGGTTWVQKTSNTTYNLSKVEFPTANVGYATGVNGVLLKTTDGGDNWQTMSTGSTSSIYGLTCISENTFFISGQAGLIKKSIDGGITFSTQYISSNETIFDIQYVDEMVGYTLSGNPTVNNKYGQLFKTIDGGNTWSILISESVDAFSFLNENIGFINKTSQSLNKTIDGGLTLQDLGPTNIIQMDIFAIDENLIWDVGINPALCNCEYFCVYKRDNSLNAEFPNIENCYDSTLGYNQLNAIYYKNGTSGYLVGALGQIYKNVTGLNVPSLTIVKHNKLDNFQIYPNPAIDKINIIINEKQLQFFLIEITDNFGKVIFTKNFYNENNINLNTSTFSKGIYFISVLSNDKKQTRKLIIN